MFPANLIVDLVLQSLNHFQHLVSEQGKSIVPVLIFLIAVDTVESNHFFELLNTLDSEIRLSLGSKNFIHLCEVDTTFLFLELVNIYLVLFNYRRVVGNESEHVYIQFFNGNVIVSDLLLILSARIF